MRMRLFTLSMCQSWFLLLPILVYAGRAECQEVSAPAKYTDAPELLVLQKQELQRIDTLGRAGDLEALTRFVAAVEMRADQNTSHFLDVLQVLSRALTTYHFAGNNHDRSYRLAQRCAFLALERADELSVTVEAQFVSVLAVDVVPETGPLPDQEQAKLRTKKAQLFLHTWKRILKATNMPPPDQGFANMPPPHGNNPAAQEAYQKALQLNLQRVERAKLYYESNRIKLSFLRRLEQYLIDAYIKPPFAIKELKTLLDAMEIPADSKRRILDEMNRKINHTE